MREAFRKLLLVVSVAKTVDCGSASHRFSPYEAEVSWSPSHSEARRAAEDTVTAPSRFSNSFLSVSEKLQELPVRILHLTDSHISLDDPVPGETSRMFNAFKHTTDYESHRPTSPKEEFTSLLRHAREKQVDLIAIGGDLVNYPSPMTVNWVLNQLHENAAGIPFIYTAGNHDWHQEGVLADKRYDSSRLTQLNSTLRPLFEHSAIASDKTANSQLGRLYGKTSVRGVDVFFADNSNHQISQEQLDYFKSHLDQDSSSPAVLLLHMPLKLDDTPPLAPKYLCGHPSWGASTDELFNIESRPQWPAEGNAASTIEFIDLVRQHSAPSGRLIALLTGHVHKDFSAKLQDGTLPNAANLTALACGSSREGCSVSHTRNGFSKASGAVQYTSLDSAEGGYRILTVRSENSRSKS